MPYQKCEEGYEDKCKEIPKKVITMSLRIVSLTCKDAPKKVETTVSLSTMPPHMSLENLHPPDWGEGDEASM